MMTGTSTAAMTNLSVADFIRAGDFDAAIERMHSLCRIQDPEVPVDATAVREQYEASRAHLRSVVPPEPFRVVVEMVPPTSPGLFLSRTRELRYLTGGQR